MPLNFDIHVDSIFVSAKYKNMSEYDRKRHWGYTPKTKCLWRN